ncbi:MAG TPA: hypothetical protein VLD67_10775 [Vicinamibacterales bacterium]|nr:hypothetical protein [Vicinamibacterales bacterium]
MEPGFRSPLIDLFKRGVPRDVRIAAAQGGLASGTQEQLALLVMLSDDPDPEVAATANATIGGLPGPSLAAFIARPDVAPELVAFFRARGIEPAASPGPPPGDAPVDTPAAAGTTGDDEAEAGSLSSLPVKDRIRLAMKGTREQRAQLIRDSNRLVATSVLNSPKLTDTEVESFAKMANVAEEVLRVIASNRGWLKNYGVVLALVRNPKTPPGISMQLLHRLNEKDTKLLAFDRNVSEAVRLAARRVVVKSLK